MRLPEARLHRRYEHINVPGEAGDVDVRLKIPSL